MVENELCKDDLRISQMGSDIRIENGDVYIDNRIACLTGCLNTLNDRLKDKDCRIELLQAENQCLRAALKPFAECGKQYLGVNPEDYPDTACVAVTIGNLRRAARAMEEE